MKHRFSNSKSDGGDATIARPSDWNAVHNTGINALSANTTIDGTYDFVACTAGGGGFTVTLPAASGNTGLTYTIMKVDSGAGNITVDANASETINGDLTYLLKNQYDTIEIVCDGSNWIVKDIRTGFSLVSQTMITTTGGSTYTVPAGVKAILMELVAGGGGGGGVTGVSSSIGAGGGGGSGGYASKFILFPTATYAVSVGIAGTAGVNTGGTGGTGGDTTVTTPAITVHGGLGGVGQVGAATLAVTAGGAGGAVSTGADVNTGGTGGQPGIRLSGTVGVSGGGAPSTLGAGAVGLTAAAPGNNAANYGGGGGGALSTAATARVGGTGSQGIIIVWEFK